MTLHSHIVRFGVKPKRQIVQCFAGHRLRAIDSADIPLVSGSIFAFQCVVGVNHRRENGRQGHYALLSSKNAERGR